MKRLKKYVSDYLLLFIGVSIFTGLLAFYFLKTRKPFVFGNDQLFQYDIFYREWFRLIGDFFRGKGLPMYSWNMYLGSDFYSSMTYYCTGDIFVILLYPLSLFVHNIKHLLTLETFVCIYLSAFFFYFFLRKKGIRNTYVIVSASLIYALGGWSVSYYGDYMFHRFYTFLPLFFLGIEQYYQDNKTALISISVAVLFMQNFYMMYPTVIFLFMYCLCLEFCFTKEVRKERFFRDFLRILLAIIIGACMAAVILIPAVLCVLTNSRVGEAGSGIFWPITSYIEVLLSPISSQFPVYTLYNDIYFLNDGGHGYWLVIYIGIVYFVSAIGYLMHKENRAHLYMALVILAIIIFKPLSSVMHGFSEPSFRWLFMLEFYLLLIGSEELDKDIKPDSMIFYVYMSLAILAVISLILMGFDIMEFKEHYAALAFYLAASIFLWFCFIKNRKIGLVFTVGEIIFLSLLNMHFKNHFGGYYERISKDDVAYYASIDEDLIYRYYMSWEDITPTALLDLNKPMDYGFMSSKTYNSMYDNVTNRFNYLNDNYRHFIDITNPYSLNMLGTKYWIAYDETFLPEELSFEHAYSLSDLQVYRNLDYMGFGFTQGKTDHLDNIQDLKEFEDTVFIDDNDIALPQGNKEYVRFNVTEKGNNSLKGNITVSDRNILFIPVPNNPGWKVYLNGQKTETISVNGGFIGIELDAGHNEIEMYFMSPGLKAGALVSLLGLAMLIILIRKEGTQSTRSS